MRYPRTMKVLRVCSVALGFLLLAAFCTWKLVIRNPTFQLFGELHSRVETLDKRVALTFDDGPNPSNTAKLLEILARHKVSATFFMVGQNIEAHPELALGVFRLGHQIANHSYSHKRMIFTPKEVCKEEITRTDQLIRDLGVKGEIYFRPPFGKKFITLPLALRDLGKVTVTWDAESEDTETQDAEVLKKNVLSRVKAGSIILFHDGGAPKPGTLGAVEAVILALRGEGYTFVTVSGLLAR